MKAVIYTDGASLGNPGHAGAGFVIYTEDKELCRGSTYLGHQTNNEAELAAIKLGVQYAQKHGVSDAIVRVDSEWACNILNGEYRLRKAHLRPCVESIRTLIEQFTSFVIEWIPREKNTTADYLAKHAAETRKNLL